jgi:hypothetical protein
MKLDLTSLLILIYCGMGIAVMLFAVVRHHRHRHALRKQPYLSAAALGKRPPANVKIPPQREVRR